MKKTDYFARAELCLGRDRKTALAQGAKTFRAAAQALRFALEEAAPVSLHGALLRVSGNNFSGDDIRRLYFDPFYPLPRKTETDRLAA